MESGRKKFQVFVSSTYTDLRDERQAAVSAILKAGHIPAGMELFASGDQSQMEVIKRWIDESDIYLLILGSRYGSVEPTSGLSFTELEYDYAVSTGKPLFAIVLEQEAYEAALKSSAESSDDRTVAVKLDAFRAKVLTKMSSFFEDTKDIRGSIYESLLDISQSRPLIGWVSASVAEEAGPLRERISLLEVENARLASEIDELKLRNSTKEKVADPQGEEFDALTDILRALNKTMPASITKEGVDLNRSVLSLADFNRNLLIKGWNFAHPITETAQWWEKEVITPLVVHKLVSLTQTATGSRKYVMTDKGLNFFAYKDLRDHKAVKSKK